MKIKFNRGPMKGKYQEFPENYGYDIRVSVPEPIDWRNLSNYDPTAPMPVREGTYHRSNVTLKNGARVYEWMGWIN